jgi:hypothetical protein
MTRYDGIAARLERIKYLTEAQAHVPATSAPYRVLAKEIHTESAAYLALVDAQRALTERMTGERDALGPTAEVCALPRYRRRLLSSVNIR